MQENLERTRKGAETEAEHKLRGNAAMQAEFDPTAPIPAPLRAALYGQLQALAECAPADIESYLAAFAQADARWRVAHPIDGVAGIAAIAANVYAPLKAALPDLERRDTIFVGGTYGGHALIACLGSYCGTMRGDWLGIPATGKTLNVRYGEVYRLDANGRVVEASLLWDVLDAMRQAGVWPLAPALGNVEMWPMPLTADGIRLGPSDGAQSAASIAQTLAMHRTLYEHDDRANLSRESLIAMPQRLHWHPKMMWYGPAGIGATRGLDGFVDGHQLPFRIAFHRPQGSFEEVTAERARHGVGHYIRIGDGPYSVTGGWPSVYALHKGGGFCGLPPTNRPVFMRVMDFYLHHKGLIRENWIPLDMLDLLNQMGFDALARMRDILRGTR
jgi:predicted ester cyclase